MPLARARHVESAVSRSPMTQPPPWYQTRIGGGSPRAVDAGWYTRAGMSPAVLGIERASTDATSWGGASAATISLYISRASGADTSVIAGPPMLASWSSIVWRFGSSGMVPPGTEIACTGRLARGVY